jgi:hypothetical protein
VLGRRGFRIVEIPRTNVEKRYDMAIPTPWRRRADAAAATDPQRVSPMSETRGAVLHLCRYPDKCCTTCDRHLDRCSHPIGRTNW